MSSWREQCIKMIKLSRPKSGKDWTRYRFAILVPVMILQSGCPSEPQAKVCIDFFNTPSTPRLKEFYTYDLEKQLTIHRCGLDWHPTEEYSYEIAQRGKVIVPALLQKLKDGDYKNSYDAEKTKYGIVLIFRRLASHGELNDDPQLIGTLEKAVSEIKTHWIRQEADESLAEIKKISNRAESPDAGKMEREN